MRIRTRILAVSGGSILFLSALSFVLGFLFVDAQSAPPELRARSLLAVLGLVLVSGGAFLVLVFRLARGFEARLAPLARAIARGRSEDRPTRVAEGPPDEIGQIERAFNDSADRRRRTEELLAARERLAEAGRLAAGIAHEMGAPMTEVLATAHLMRERGAAAPELLDDLVRSAERAREILGDFLARAKPLPVAPRAIEVAPVVERAIARFRAAHRTAPAIAWEIPPEPAIALADPDRLEEALLNLLRNAAEAGGATRVSLARDPVEIRVADDGPGVPAPLRARLFEPFVRGSKKEGTGLGLWMSRRNLEAMGGRLDLEVPSDAGAVGSGAVFRIRLASVPGAPGGAA